MFVCFCRGDRWGAENASGSVGGGRCARGAMVSDAGRNVLDRADSCPRVPWPWLLRTVRETAVAGES